MNLELPLFFAAMMLATLICSQADRIGAALGLMDVPDMVGGRKRHLRPTPLIGGSAALLPTFGILAVGTVLADFPTRQVQSDILLITFASALLYLVGLLDDRRGLSARFRLLVGLILCWIAVMATPNLQLSMLLFSGSSAPLVLGVFAVPMSILCLVGLLNAVNMADGKDGLVTFCCTFWTGLLIYYAPPFLRPALSVLLGAMLTVFLFNLRGRLFLGDNGSYGLAALIGFLTIYVYNLRFDVLAADQIMLWFLIPVVDCLRVLVSRGLRGQSPFAPDRSHLHHYLAARWTWEQGRYVYWTLIAMPSLAATYEPRLTVALVLLTLAVYTLLVVRLRLLPEAKSSQGQTAG